jgi:hypothetical protein
MGEPTLVELVGLYRKAHADRAIADAVDRAIRPRSEEVWERCRKCNGIASDTSWDLGHRMSAIGQEIMTHEGRTYVVMEGYVHDFIDIPEAAALDAISQTSCTD